MATAPELIGTTNGTGEAIVGEVVDPSEETTDLAPQIDPSLDSGRSLSELESVIERSIESQVDAGIALLEIQARGLFRDQGYDSFTGYLQARWGYLSAGYKLMDAAKVKLALTDGGKNSEITLPKNEAQAREIAPLVRKNPDAARAVWSDLVATHDPSQITAADIKNVVQAKLAELRPAKADKPKVRETDTPQIGAKDTDVRYRSFYGDPSILGGHLAPSSVDLMTYRVKPSRNAATIVQDWAETASTRLKKGGSALFLCSPALLPVVLENASQYLTYKWVLVRPLEIGENDHADKPTVYNGYQAIVWFTKGKYTGEMVDDILDPEGDGFKGLVEVMVKENGLIGAGHFDQAEVGDMLYLLNQNRRVVVATVDKSALATFDTNARAQNFMPEDAETDRAGEAAPEVEEDDFATPESEEDSE